MGQSVLNTQRSIGVLAQQSLLNQQSFSKKQSILGFSLNLTTLIDAFCILVIFLLTNMNGQNQTLNIAKQITLPSAHQNELLDAGLSIQILKDAVFVEEKKLLIKEVAEYLTQLKANHSSATNADKKFDSLIIQADRNANFELISDVLRAAGQAGFSKYAFAVWPTTK